MIKIEKGIKMIEFEAMLDFINNNLFELLYQYYLCTNLFELNKTKKGYNEKIFDNHSEFLSYSFFCISEYTILGFYKIFENNGKNNIYKLLSYLKQNYTKIDKELEIYFNNRSKEDSIYTYNKLDYEYIIGIEQKINDFSHSDIFKKLKEIRDKRIAHNDINKGNIYFDFKNDLLEIYTFIFNILNELKSKIFFGDYGHFLAEDQSKQSIDFLFNELGLAEYFHDIVLDEEMKNENFSDGNLQIILDLNAIRKYFFI